MVTKKNYVYVCRKCKRPHSLKEFKESRFCRNCGMFLSQKDSKHLNHVSTINDEKHLGKEEILKWSRKHNEAYPWWIRQEKELGYKFRTRKELTKDDLVEVVKWKFDTLAGRKKRILGLVARNEDKEIRRVTNLALSSPSSSDFYKVNTLCKIYGVGPSLASTILTFCNPKEYGVFDIHVWRELFGKEQGFLFTTKNYLKLLDALRKIAKKCDLDVRVVEKALFKKNIEEEK